MGMHHKIQVGDKIIRSIDWEMSPDLSFGTYESWGGRERVRNNAERVYYFFIDNWGDKPKLCLMERGVKHAEIMAEIKAPREIIRKCIEGQGHSAIFEKSYAINDQVKNWLIENVLDCGDPGLVVPRVNLEMEEDMGPDLLAAGSGTYSGQRISLPAEPAIINDDEIGGIISTWNFFDAELNPGGRFTNDFAASADPLTLIDRRTSLMWQRSGLDIASARTMQRGIAELNMQNFAGHSDWRLPAMEEAMSLMEPEKNKKGIYLDPVFSKEQPFIFVAAQRKPGGYWFVDYKQGRSFWSSGTIPGGFGRVVRSFDPEAGSN